MNDVGNGRAINSQCLAFKAIKRIAATSFSFQFNWHHEEDKKINTKWREYDKEEIFKRVKGRKLIK
jgi:hypothetical protein